MSGVCSSCHDGCRGGCEAFLTTFRGREMLHLDLDRALLVHCTEALGDIAKVEQGSRLEGRAMILLLAPKQAQPAES